MIPLTPHSRRRRDVSNTSSPSESRTRIVASLSREFENTVQQLQQARRLSQSPERMLRPPNRGFQRAGSVQISPPADSKSEAAFRFRCTDFPFRWWRIPNPTLLFRKARSLFLFATLLFLFATLDFVFATLLFLFATLLFCFATLLFVFARSLSDSAGWISVSADAVFNPRTRGRFSLSGFRISLNGFLISLTGFSFSRMVFSFSRMVFSRSATAES